MEEAAPTGQKRRGMSRWKRYFLIILSLPFILFGLSNLIFASSWAREWVAARIQRATGLETTIGGASWSPWAGASLYDIRVLQPTLLRGSIKDPVISIAKIRAVPDWKSWFYGEREIRSLHLDSPRVVIPVQLLSHLIPRPQEPEPTANPPVAQNPPPPLLDPTPGPTSLEVQPAPPQPEPPPIAENPAPPAPPAVTSPTRWIQIKNGSFALVSAGLDTRIFELTGLGGVVPVAGSPALSKFHIGRVKSAGHVALSNLTLPLKWTSPFLVLENTATETNGIKLNFAARLAMLAGFPIQFNLVAPRQPLKSTAMPAGATAEAEIIVLEARMVGLLLSPVTLQADVVGETTKPTVKFGEQEATFDRGRAVVVLRNGNIGCLDARLIGDDLSVLGNATLLSDGRAAAVARFVAPPESSLKVVNHFLPGLRETPFITPLSTPQRAALDLELFGQVGQPFRLRLGQGGPVVNIATP